MGSAGGASLGAWPEFKRTQPRPSARGARQTCKKAETSEAIRMMAPSGRWWRPARRRTSPRRGELRRAVAARAAGFTPAMLWRPHQCPAGGAGGVGSAASRALRSRARSSTALAAAASDSALAALSRALEAACGGIPRERGRRSRLPFPPAAQGKKPPSGWRKCRSSGGAR